MENITKIALTIVEIVGNVGKMVQLWRKSFKK